MKYPIDSAEAFNSEPTPICDSCACDGARLGETVSVPASVARKLEKEWRFAERNALYYKAACESWANHANFVVQPDAFYQEYSEATMRAMQALLSKQKERNANLELAVLRLLDQVDPERNTEEPASRAINRAKKALFEQATP